jgi:hypothetical protein
MVTFFSGSLAEIPEQVSKAIMVTRLIAEANTVNLLAGIEYAAYGLAVDYSGFDFTPTPHKIADTDSGDSKNVVTVCGKAIDSSDIGNIMFGLGGAARGYDLGFVYPSAMSFNAMSDAGIVQKVRGALGPDARGAIVGWYIGQTGSYMNKASMCREMAHWEWLGYHDNATQLAGWLPSTVVGQPVKAPLPSSLERVSGKGYTLSWLNTLLHPYFPFIP